MVYLHSVLYTAEFSSTCTHELCLQKQRKDKHARPKHNIKVSLTRPFNSVIAIQSYTM